MTLTWKHLRQITLLKLKNPKKKKKKKKNNEQKFFDGTQNRHKYY